MAFEISHLLPRSLSLSRCSLFVTNKHIDPGAVCQSVSGEFVKVVCRPQQAHMINTWPLPSHCASHIQCFSLSQHPHPPCWATILLRNNNNRVWSGTRWWKHFMQIPSEYISFLSVRVGAFIRLFEWELCVWHMFVAAKRNTRLMVKDSREHYRHIDF